jgi:hypothetical protein
LIVPELGYLDRLVLGQMVGNVCRVERNQTTRRSR